MGQRMKERAQAGLEEAFRSSKLLRKNRQNAMRVWGCSIPNTSEMSPSLAQTAVQPPSIDLDSETSTLGCSCWRGRILIAQHPLKCLHHLYVQLFTLLLSALIIDAWVQAFHPTSLALLLDCPVHLPVPQDYFPIHSVRYVVGP